MGLVAKSAPLCKPLSKLAEIIAKEIAEGGIIPFARFMELALYCPEYGFYEKERDRIGRRGDYFTSVSVGEVFGRLLAFQFAAWAEKQKTEHKSTEIDSRIRLVEGGGHDGRLAQDILSWLRKERADIFSRLDYCLVEPSEGRRGWQRERLADYREQVSWVADPSALVSSPPQWQIIFCNELLDAMPVHRLRWDAGGKRWFEWGVSYRAGKFEWARMPARKEEPIWRHYTSRVTHGDLSDGFVLDICPAAEQWWGAASRALGSGKLLTLDYGLTAEELLAPERTEGTLRGFRRHQISNDILASPGEQDLTAHVNFSALQAMGEAAGLRTECVLTQEQFLMHILQKVAVSESQPLPWTESQRRQLQTLTHPGFMGQQFRVLVQSR
jgi:SAM-dependent MidA family methyltransferase